MCCLSVIFLLDINYLHIVLYRIMLISISSVKAYMSDFCRVFVTVLMVDMGDSRSLVDF